MRPAVIFVCAVAIVLPAWPSALHAEGSSQPFSAGGYVPDFIKVIRGYNASGEPFRIEGTCKSACTLFLGIRNVCVERSATLMVHGGHDIKENVTGPNTRASRAALYRYNDALRQYVLDNHFLDTDEFHPLPGSMLIDRFGYRECAAK
jgi:hypothetical protein